MPALLHNPIRISSWDDDALDWLHDTDRFDTEPYPELPGICDGDGEIDPAMVHANLLTLPEDDRERYLIDMEIDPATIGDYL